MTNNTKAPERIVTSKCGKTIVHDGMKRFEGDIEWVPYDLHLSLVAAENQACFDACVGEYLEDEPETEEDKAYDRAVAGCLRAIHKRTSTDAQAARDARDKRIREEALREAANVAHDAVLDNGDDQVQVRFAVLALIEKEQTDE